MKRLYKRTLMEAVGAGSDWFQQGDKALVAQLEPNPAKPTYNLLVEYWPSREAKDADLAEAKEQAKPAPAKPTASGTDRVIVFVSGPHNLWGFVKDVDEAGSYALCSYPDHAFDFKSTAGAYEALKRVRSYERRHYNWDNNFYVLKDGGHLKAERKPPETQTGEIAFLHRD